MPYRRRGGALAVTTAEGVLRIAIDPDALELVLGNRIVRIALTSVAGRIVVTRNGSTRGLAIWIEDATGAMVRVFGVAAHHAAEHARALEAAAQEIQTVLLRHAGDIVRAVELGRGGELLVVELADRLVVYAARLFRAHARPVMAMERDGRLTFAHGAEGHADDRLAIDVVLPRVTPDIRAELIRRFVRRRHIARAN